MPANDAERVSRLRAAGPEKGLAAAAGGGGARKTSSRASTRSADHPRAGGLASEAEWLSSSTRTRSRRSCESVRRPSTSSGFARCRGRTSSRARSSRPSSTRVRSGPSAPGFISRTSRNVSCRTSRSSRSTWPSRASTGEIEARLKKGGQPLADADLQIAATAIRHGLELVTGNVRHFERVPGLAEPDPGRFPPGLRLRATGPRKTTIPFAQEWGVPG